MRTNLNFVSECVGELKKSQKLNKIKKFRVSSSKSSKVPAKYVARRLHNLKIPEIP